jgi:hypothetical protein
LTTSANLNKVDKSLVVVGDFDFVGAHKTVQTKLASAANPGDMSLTLAADIILENWQIGDKIVIAPSGFNPNEYEYFAITDIEGSQIWLNNPIQYYHHGADGPLATSAGDLDMRAEVGMMSG